MEHLKGKTIVITSREPFNQEGNSHMHYLTALLKTNKVIFIDPPKRWPSFNIKSKRIGKNLTLFPYINIFPYKLSLKVASIINDILTSFFLQFKIQKKEQVILWQFDPYYLEKTPFLNFWRKIYFPLDGYSKDPRDKLFAEKADLLVTVNSTFIEHYYNKYNDNILLLPHGFSDFQLNADKKEVNSIKNHYRKFVVFTGSLSEGVDFTLLHKLAKAIYPNKLLIIGKSLVKLTVTKKLFELENVFFLGLKPYTELKHYIAAAACCIVAYNKSTGGWRNPIKITDYAAQLKPIINTTPLKDLETLEHAILHTTQDHDKFIDKTLLALENKLIVNTKLVEEYILENKYKNLITKIARNIR